MKFQLINERNYRQDGVEDSQSEFDCKVPNAIWESTWEKRLGMGYLGWDTPENLKKWKLTGRNHIEIKPHFWQKEIEVFGWWVHINTLEELLIFIEAWNCIFDGGAFWGRFSD